MLIGITGTDGAGKGTVVEELVTRHGYTHYSARALITTELELRGLTANRENFRLVANELRREHGPDYVATYYIAKAATDGVTDCVIESIRTAAEASAIQAAGGVIVAVDADQKLRYQRIQARKSETDSISFEEFVRHEELEMHDPDPNGMQKASVINLANCTVYNDGPIDEVPERVRVLLDQLT